MPAGGSGCAADDFYKALTTTSSTFIQTYGHYYMTKNLKVTLTLVLQPISSTAQQASIQPPLTAFRAQRAQYVHGQSKLKAKINSPYSLEVSILIALALNQHILGSL